MKLQKFLVTLFTLSFLFAIVILFTGCGEQINGPKVNKSDQTAKAHDQGGVL